MNSEIHEMRGVEAEIRRVASDYAEMTARKMIDAQNRFVEAAGNGDAAYAVQWGAGDVILHETVYSLLDSLADDATSIDEALRLIRSELTDASGHTDPFSRAVQEKKREAAQYVVRLVGPLLDTDQWLVVQGLK